MQRSCQAEPISDALQVEILDLLAAQVGPDAAGSDVASHLLLRLCRAESSPAFRAMLRSRHEELRELGALALHAHGETLED